MPIYQVRLLRHMIEETTVYVEADSRSDVYDDLEEEDSAVETHADNTSTWEGDHDGIEAIFAHQVDESPGPPVLKLKRPKE